MTIEVKHNFTSTKPDSPDATLIQPSNWNDVHQVTGLGTAAELNVGTTAGTVAAGDHTHSTLPTANEKAAMGASASPSAVNAFATMSEVALAAHTHSTLPTSNQKAALDAAVNPSGSNAFATMSEVALAAHIHSTLPTSNEKAAMGASVSPSVGNPFATMSEVALASHTHSMANITGLQEALTSGRVIVVTPNPEYGQYSSIATACTVAASYSPDPWVVRVTSGNYSEPAITVSGNTHIVGDSEHSIRVTASTTGYDLFTFAAGSSLSYLTASDLPDSTKAAFKVHDAGDYVVFHKATYLGTGVGFDISSDIVATKVYMEQCDTEGTVAGLRVRSLGSALCFVNIENSHVYGTNPTLVRGLSVSGPNCLVQIGVFGVEAEPGHTATGIYIEDGAQVYAQGGVVRGFDKNVHVANVGAAPTLRLLSTPLRDAGTKTLHVEHPGTTGVFTGTSNTSQVDTSAATGFTLNYTDVTNNRTVMTGSLFLGPNGSNVTNASALIVDAAPMGLLSGGVLSPTGGLGVSVASGVGYLRSSGVVQRVEWGTQSVTMNSGETSYIYINSSGVANKSGSLPDLLTSILIGRVSAGASSLTALGGLAVNINNYGNKIEDWLRYAVGPVYVSGSIVTESLTTPRAIDVTAGKWYYGTVARNPSSKTAPTMVAIYPVSGVPTTGYISTVPNGVYDNGTDIVSMTAGYYTKHDIYQASEGAFQTILFVHGQTQWATQAEAEASPNPTPLIVPDATPKIASFIMQQGVNSIVKIIDARPLMFRAGSGSGGGTSNHSNLTNLTADDHLQYLLVNGTRAMTGSLDMGTNAITNVGTVDGVDISAHSSRHLPNGADPITTATAISLSNLTTNTVGIQNSLARSDHTHAITGFEPAIATGTTSQYIRGDKSLATLDKATVGLGNVDNTSDANKPVSTAQSTAIGLKLDAANLPAVSVDSEVTLFNGVSGKELKRSTLNATVVKSTNGVLSAAVAGTDYLTPTGSGAGLSGVEPTIATGTTSQYIRGDKSLATLDKTAVGLGNVDNTSDVNKPVSTAQSTAIGLKLDSANLPSVSVDSEVTLFSGITGKELKRSALNATVVKSTNGVLSAAVAGTDYLTPTGSGAGLSGVEPTIATGTTSQYIRGDKSLATLDKAAVGLNNVDNTSDANKPVSTAQSTAIGLKLDAANLPSTSVDSEVALFSSTTGKVLKRSTLTASVVKSTAGVLSAAVAGTDYLSPTGSGTGLTGVELSANRNAANGYAGLTSGKLDGAQQTYGTAANTACVGNDSRLSDARAPLAHTQAESTITFTDITTGNADITKHGFLPKLPGGTTTFLRADGTFATPTASASAGGATTNIQFNNAGAIDGSNNFTYDPSTNTMSLVGSNPDRVLGVVTAEPSNSAASTITEYAATIAGKVYTKVIGPAGLGQVIQPSILTNAIYTWNTTTATAGLWTGTAGAGAGTFGTTLPVSSTNRYLQIKRSRWANVVTTANQVLGQRNTEAMFFRGNNAGEGGFFFFCRFGIETWTSGGRIFVGMATGTTVISAEPSALNNTVGFCVDSTDSAITFLTRGTVATKATIAGQPALAASQGYDAYIYCKPNDSVIYYRLDNVNTGATIVDSSTSTTLPSATTLLTANALMSNAALTPVTSVQIGINKMYIEVGR